ncbi:MAG: hypothetical protein E6G44_07910 [Actinobacteria bacterium]|nr:MAG: hypothetical protein E6G44_07910 [Actinomycetota bacterium]
MLGRSRARASTRFAVLSVLVLTTGVLLASAPAASPSPSGSLAKVDASVLRQIHVNGSARFWVLFRQQADLSRASAIADWTARGAFVVDSLKAVASSSQRAMRAELAGSHVAYRSFWIVNGILVTRGTAATLEAAAARPEVSRIAADWHGFVIMPLKGRRIKSIGAVEWNIKNIRANKVWKLLGDRGAGSVVAAIDTGAQFDHPALVNAYRGNQGGGSFNHNYNWWDPSHICPQPKPCDNVGHGTHTMGTMVGRAGVNKIGVAPNAKWIEAKGCESNSCSSSALLSSGQFMLAPTDLNGNNPDPSKRPDVVNNSWGSGSGSDTFYQATVNSWVAAGIFPQFSNVNAGPNCGTVRAPGSYINSYGAGAYDINNVIASFSSRGPSPFGGEIKPNISAPGVNVRSSVPTNGYASFSGTSMASPHVAGTIALVISKNPSLRGNISQLRTIIDNSGIDVNALTCGGTLDDNNVFGEGRLDAYAAVLSAASLGGSEATAGLR